MNEQNKPRFWHKAWWQQNRERGLWAGTVAVIVLLLAVTVYATPDLRESIFPSIEQPQISDAGVNPAADPPQILEPGLSGAEQPGEGDLPTAEQPGASGQPTAEQPGQESTGQDETMADPDQSLAVLADPSLLAEIEAENPPAMILPVPSLHIDRGYGYDYNPNTEDYRFHRGYDLSVAEESAVMAAADGTVAEAYSDEYWGGVVVLDHGGGWRTIYRCLRPSVAVGDSVRSGDGIGFVILSAAEAVQSSHLHVELECDGESVNPALHVEF